MRVIHKFELNHDGFQVLPIGDTAHVLHIGEQAGCVCLWIDRDEAEPGFRTFTILGTGIPYDEVGNITYTHCGTVQMVDGMVWHVFEIYEFSEAKQ